MVPTENMDKIMAAVAFLAMLELFWQCYWNGPISAARFAGGQGGNRSNRSNDAAPLRRQRRITFLDVNF
jgi:hypothetical protein